MIKRRCTQMDRLGRERTSRSARTKKLEPRGRRTEEAAGSSKVMTEEMGAGCSTVRSALRLRFQALLLPAAALVQNTPEHLEAPSKMVTRPYNLTVCEKTGGRPSPDKFQSGGQLLSIRAGFAADRSATVEKGPSGWVRRDSWQLWRLKIQRQRERHSGPGHTEWFRLWCDQCDVQVGSGRQHPLKGKTRSCENKAAHERPLLRLASETSLHGHMRTNLLD